MFRKLGVEVLLMYDRVDEWVVSALTEFEGKPLRSVARGDLDLSKLGDRDRCAAAGTREASTRICSERMQTVLTERASGVRATHRLTDSPACLVSDEHGMSTNLERLLKASGQNVPVIKPHPRDQPVATRSWSVCKDEADTDRFSDWSHILFDQATLGRRRAARRPRDVREAAQRVDARAGGRPRVADLDAGLTAGHGWLMANG